MSHSQERGSLRLRVHTMSLDGYIVKKIDVKGVFPKCALYEDVDFSVSVFDCEDGGIHPILSAETEFQEPGTLVYESRVNIGEVLPHNKKVNHWRPAAVLVPDASLGPYGGERELVAVVRLINSESNVHIEAGRVVEGDEGVMWVGEVKFNCMLPYEGYFRLAKERRRIQSMIIRLAAAVAFADGSLNSEELGILKRKTLWWIRNSEIQFDALSKKQRSSSYRGMMKRALNRAGENGINTTRLLKNLRNSADQELWRETLELCYELIAVNGAVHASQLHLLREISNSSGLYPEELAEVRDKYAVALVTEPMVEVPVEELLGIDPSWDQARTRMHLRLEYKKWNGRLNTIPEGKSRENAQRILDMIGEAYKKFTFPQPEPQVADKGDQVSRVAARSGQSSKSISKDDQVSETDHYMMQLDLFEDWE